MSLKKFPSMSNKLEVLQTNFITLNSGNSKVITNLNIDSYYLFWVKNGQLVLDSKSNSFLLLENQYILLKSVPHFEIYSAVQNCNVYFINFTIPDFSLNDTLESTYSFTSDLKFIFENIELEIANINLIRRKKPSITYDKEIGDLFLLHSSLLTTQITEVLLTTQKNRIFSSLPVSEQATISTKRTVKSLKTEQTTTYKYLTNDELVLQIIEFMKNNLDLNLTIEDIAERFLISSSTLKKIFKQSTKTSIISFFKNLKIEKAKILIRENKLSYTEIATQLGFGSLHHFSADFKNKTGLSPSKYFEKYQPNHKENLNMPELIANNRPWST